LGFDVSLSYRVWFGIVEPEARGFPSEMETIVSCVVLAGYPSHLSPARKPINTAMYLVSFAPLKLAVICLTSTSTRQRFI
jgi:hypothetical protein